MFVIKTSQREFSREEIERCAGVLAAGGIGVVPTDTVYGIAALATSAEAVERLMALKRRAADKPLPVQVATAWDANLLGVADGPTAAALIEAFWPGPLTMVVERRGEVALPFQDSSTIGLRIPASEFCRALITTAGYLVVPSANLPGKRPPVTAGELAGEVLDSVDFVVDAGPCPGGVESTVVDITTGVKVLREGALTSEALKKAITGGGSAHGAQ